jgi:5-methylcytosine-specific restriction endonuclease McrA
MRDGRAPECKMCVYKRVRGWINENPEMKREQNRRWFSNNTEKKLEKVREWSANNPEKRREIKLRFRKNHPEKDVLYQSARRALKKKNGGTITVAQWSALKKFYNYTCLCCKKKEPTIKLTIDHVLPIKHGGKNSIENTQCLCGLCNSEKGVEHIDYRPIIFYG